jgi:DNA-binding winged helix-turn-helix (wHTH) protein/TolB-like protein
MSDNDVRVIYEFCGFRADPLTRRLFNRDEDVALTPKAFETLLILIAHRGQILSKNELIDSVWAETAVEENNLTQQIAALRRIFGERPGDHRFIVTVPGSGYSFVAPVNELEIDASEELIVYEATKSTLTVDISPLGTSFGRERVFGSVVALAYIFIVCVAGFWPLVSGDAPSPPQTVAVLTFRAASSEDEVLGAGIRDTLRARLGTLADVTVRPAATSIQTDDSILAGKQLEADTIFTGSVQRENDRVRVAVEMIDVRNRRIVWGQTFDYDRSRVFEMQDAIAGEAVRVIRGSLL